MKSNQIIITIQIKNCEGKVNWKILERNSFHILSNSTPIRKSQRKSRFLLYSGVYPRITIVRFVLASTMTGWHTLLVIRLFTTLLQYGRQQKSLSINSPLTLFEILRLFLAMTTMFTWIITDITKVHSVLTGPLINFRVVCRKIF